MKCLDHLNKIKKKMNNSIPETILDQLGGNEFKVMVGAKNLSTNGKNLSCKIMRNKTGSNYLTVTLNSLDTYNVEFINVRAGKRTIKASFEDIYNDQLRGLFEDVTGLRTSLSAIYGDASFSV